MNFLRTFLVLLSFFGAIQAQVVPQVALCNKDDCPMVSRIGLGTLHIGDKISGISDVNQINNWINSAVQLGITLFDLADVYPVKGGDAGDSATLFGKALAVTPGLREKIVSFKTLSSIVCS